MRLFASLTGVAIFSVLLLAQEPPQDGKQKRTPPAPKNLQVLTVEDLRGGIMRQFTVALGGNCDTCHVADRASDDNPHKVIAREMIKMTKEINGKFPDGKTHVTCYTCHRGSHEPAMAPPPADKPAQ